MLYRTFTFNDCPEAAKELQAEILEARKDLIAKGFKFRDWKQALKIVICNSIKCTYKEKVLNSVAIRYNMFIGPQIPLARKFCKICMFC